jgi:hypothetical protein
MDNDEGDKVITDERFERTSEGMAVPCPVCREDSEMTYTPHILLSEGRCFECSTSFSVSLRWDVE